MYYQSMLIIVIVICLLRSVQTYETFAEYVVRFSKVYTDAELPFRQAVYEAKIASFANITNFVPGINNFTDWTEEEIKSLSQLKQLPFEQRVSSKLQSVRRLSAPTSVDWRDKGTVTSVKNQGYCGACWAFASISLMQSFLVKRGSSDLNINLSEQFLVQCTPSSSCYGGYIQDGIDRILSKAPTESQYAYIAFYGYGYGGSICSADGVSTNTQRYSYYNMTDGDFIDLLQNQALAVAVASSGWASYSSGVLSCSSNAQIDHAVVVVGYTPDYYIIKNSWGASWGMNGYGFVSRKSSQNCKITSQAHRLNEIHTLKGVLIITIMFIIVLI